MSLNTVILKKLSLKRATLEKQGWKTQGGKSKVRKSNVKRSKVAQSKAVKNKVVQGEILLSQEERGAKRNVPTPEPQTAIPVARALYNKEKCQNTAVFLEFPKYLKGPFNYLGNFMVN